LLHQLVGLSSVSSSGYSSLYISFGSTILQNKRLSSEVGIHASHSKDNLFKS